MVAVTRVQKALKGVDYPASREALVEAATGNGAEADVIELLENIEDRTFEGPNGVMKALKGDLGGSDAGDEDENEE